MHITIACPRCLREYHLDDSLGGQRIHCPNPLCREIFQVRPENSQPAPPANAAIIPEQAGLQPLPGEQVVSERTGPAQPSTPVTGSVGDLVPILPAVAEDEGPPLAHEVPPAKPPSARVEEMVPLLPAESVYELEPVTRKQAPSWQQPPPVRVPSPDQPDQPAAESDRRAVERRGPDRRKKAADTVELTPGNPFEASTAPAPAGAADNGQQATAGELVEVPPGAWEAPPVRRPEGEEGPPATPLIGLEGDVYPPVAAVEHPGEELDDVIPTRHWGRRIILAMLGLAVAAGVAVVLMLPRDSEDRRYEQARAKYDAGQLADAGTLFRELVEKFPESPRKQEYQFFAELSGVRDLVEAINPDVAKGPKQLRTFLQDHAGDPLLKENRDDIWKSCKRLIEVFTAQAAQGRGAPKPDFPQARRSLKSAKQWVADARKYLKVSDAQLQPMEGAIGEEEQAIAKAEHDAAVLARLDSLPQTFEGLIKFKQMMEQEGLANDSRVSQRYQQFRTAVVGNVTYVKGPPRSKTPRRAEEPSLVIGEPAPPGFHSEGVWFALARGVLYALDQRTGFLLWYTRIGSDPVSLPVPLPPRDGLGRENVLVLSTDTNTSTDIHTLACRDARTGDVRWTHGLGERPAVGRPVIVRQRVYVPTDDGTVHEIELAQGHLIGQFKLGLPLSNGGVEQPGTDLVYFPAESQAVYVLDVAAHTCVATLLTEHAAGSLRGEPILISRHAVREAFGKNVVECPDYLVLNQADGLNGMRLRVWSLAAQPKDSEEGSPDSQPRIPGWSQFAPYHDGEKVVQVTDAGKLIYLGINQVGNQDRPLFVQSINDLLKEGNRGSAGASQVVYASEDDIWVLAGGELQRRHYDQFGRQDDQFAPRLPPLWQLPLGSPLHASQVDASGRKLFLVTQSLAQQHCTATAVNAEDGTVLWQRQLGLVCQGEPLVLGQGLLVLDQGGGLYLFDPGQPPRHLNGPWRVGGRLLAGPLPQGAIASSLLPGPGGSAYQITTVDRGEKGYELVVRRYEPGKDLFQKTFRGWPAALGGTPGVESNSVLLPLVGGKLRRQELNKKGEEGADGPDWRATRADEGAQRHVVVIRDGEFLITDGSTGLARFHWPVGNDQLDQLKKLGELFLPARIVTAPLLLPRDEAHPDLRALVADNDGNVTLVQGDDLKVKGQWKLKVKISAGPYGIGQTGRQFACVVDGRRLVRFDLDKADVRWEYQPPEGIVGRPQLVGDLLVVANGEGAFVGLDPATGKPRREPGYTLRANAAPAASPVAFGPDLLFAPLTDGTVLLLPRKELRPLAK